MKEWINKIFAIGTAEIADHRLRNQVRFANILGLTISVFGFLFFAVNVFVRDDLVMAWFTLCLMPVGLLVILFNFSGHHRIARIIIAFFPLAVCVFLPPMVIWFKGKGMDLPPGEMLLELIHSKMAAVSVTVCPFVLLDMRKKANLIVVPIITFVLVMLIDPLRLAIHSDLYASAGVSAPMAQYSNFITFSVVTVVLLCMFFISRLNIRFEDRMLAMIGELNLKSAKLKAEIDLRLQSEMEMQRAKDEALDAVRSRTAFFAHINHEIRTPLHGIVGLTSLLDEPATVEEKHKLHASLKLSTAELMRLVNNVLDLNKIESEKFDLHLRSFDLVPFFQKVAANYTGISQLGGTECHVEVVPNSPMRLMADDLRLAQVLHNLIVNAVKHGKATRVQIGFEAETSSTGVQSVVFFVIDNGIGMNQIIEHHNVENGAVSEFLPDSNHGFGLVISQKILEQMGSNLHASRGLSGGTVFKFTLRTNPPD